MIRIREAIVVEGKYDRMRLNTLFDTSIIETGGFHVMNDSALKEMIRRLGNTQTSPVYLSSLKREGISSLVGITIS